MEIVEYTAKNHHKYDRFVESHHLGSIHQTWDWGFFQAKSRARDRFWAMGVENEHGQIMASVLMIRQRLPFGKCWLYAPRGPLTDYTKEKTLKLLLEKIRELAKKENAIFSRFDPAIKKEEKINWKAIKSHPAHAHYQPESTLILDLSLSEKDLLRQMKPKGRYNIKVAQKHGVTVKVSGQPEKDVEIFYKLLHQTTARDRFSSHPLEYYRNMLAVLGKKKAKLYLAQYEEQTIAAIIVTFFKDTATYYFGASGNEHRNVMAPYLLQWQAVLDAKNAGCKYYDFLGIAPENTPDHPWAGVTDFKLKFGGMRVNHVPAQEIIYRPFWYLLMKFAKWLRNKMPF